MITEPLQSVAMIAVVGNVLAASVAVGLFAFTIRARRRR